MTPLQTLLAQLREDALHTRDLGNKFERLVVAYLTTDRLYSDKYTQKSVWLWHEWPDRWGNDNGIDIVAKDVNTGEYCAIQCKFFDPDNPLEKSHIDSFFNESGKEFSTSEGPKKFSHRVIFSTTDRWSKNAEAALKNQLIPVTRLGVNDLENSTIDWSLFNPDNPLSIFNKKKKSIRPHQQIALDQVQHGFESAERGQLIMACGTGKTFTALKIAEQQVPSDGLVLFLVPSIALISQTLREWTAESEKPLHCVVVCSDTKVHKRGDADSEDISLYDLALPATTKVEEVVQYLQDKPKDRLTVIFSTYHSIQVISDAQQAGWPEYDLIICDEAHRTTGVTLNNEEESHFVKVHSQDFIRAKKRLYMTATPRLFADDIKVKAKENDAVLCSMDNETLYGKEFHRLGFSQAVNEGLLSDYQVMILAVEEKFISQALRKQIADTNNEITLSDAVKIIGCWNGLAKRLLPSENDDVLETDSAPMRRAVAFAGTIKDSERITDFFPKVIEDYRQHHPDKQDLLHCELQHVDGKHNALERNKKLNWLKEEPTEHTCRILSNARCLSEGVDVPALDAVMFLNPRNSQVDVVQSVGRVMRKAEGKKYGYVILPISISADMDPEKALNDHKRYKVVWQVLQALRSHDEHFNAIVNKIELNKTLPRKIRIIGIGGEGSGAGNPKPSAQLALPFFKGWRDAIYAKIVTKCGDRRYWEHWAKDIAVIAERHVTRIQTVLEHSEHRTEFDRFLSSLQAHLNPSVSEKDAVEMLAQHLITQPVFDALFEGYAFTQHNPVSQAMQAMLSVLEGHALNKETKTLEKFYNSVRKRAEGIDNDEGKQKIILELYDTFFKTAFPRMAERLGIVYTPVEVVDFILHSVNDALEKEFHQKLGEKGVHIIDPFTGTGTFITRLLQSGVISPEQLAYKYHHEIHANEIVLLAYYIAAINIESVYHGIMGGEYSPFPGIVLTDTFQLSEAKKDLTYDHETALSLEKNSERANTQKAQDITVIIGNPPYSAGQTSANDNNQNVKYPQLDHRIRETYTEHSTSTNKNSLYDSYIRAIRWASDRIDRNGIICFVTNGSFIDGNAADGLRKCLTDEFSSIYCFNLRGSGRATGEALRIEGRSIFDYGIGGSRVTTAIVLFIKNPNHQGSCKLFYFDISKLNRPDKNSSRKDKLEIIKNFKSINGIKWQELTPNDSHDWINQRNVEFAEFISIGNKDKENTEKTIFDNYSRGVATSRDSWVYNFSKENLVKNVNISIDFYNSEVQRYIDENCQLEAGVFVKYDSTKFTWDRANKWDLEKGKRYDFEITNIVKSMYRPFCLQYLYFHRQMNNMLYQMPKIFPNESVSNVVICVTGRGATKDFSALVSNILPDLEMISKGQCFPLYTYEKHETEGDSLFGTSETQYQKKENISDTILSDFKNRYCDPIIGKEDIFYYVYGVLHSPEYKSRFANDLKKMLPRIPFASDFWGFSHAGRRLGYWHLNYETVEPYPVQETVPLLPTDGVYRVHRMTFGKKGKESDKSTIVYNSYITLSGIPLEAYEYVVNGKSALEWIMERYAVTVDKDSGIRNDANDWSEDPRYIVDLIKRIVRVSMETVKIVKGLPALG